MKHGIFIWAAFLCCGSVATAGEFHKPYGPPCTERENVFEFTEKPRCVYEGDDKYAITFAVKGYCDVTVAIVDPDPGKDVSGWGRGTVVRHLASGVLGPNAPTPLQKNSLKQKIYWDGKCDLEDYVREPGKLVVRVMLGLKPEFDKRLGDTNPKNLPGFVAGIATSEEGVFLIVKGIGSHGGVTMRKFDHDGKYVEEILPPMGDRPLEKYPGMGFVEYEPGKKTLHARSLDASVCRDAFWCPAMSGKAFGDIQPVIVGKRLFFTNPGVRRNTPHSLLHYVYTDGTTDEKGMAGRLFAAINGKHQSHSFPRLAVSPDGKRIYVTNLLGKNESPPAPSVVLACETEGDEPTTIFAGGPDKLGARNDQFSDPACVDVDAAGRVYVADRNNSRVQIFSAEGKYLKTIPVDRPTLVSTPKKTGGIYVLHLARRSGKSIPCLTKFVSFEDLREAYHVDDFKADIMAIDCWAAKPRLWTAGGGNRSMGSIGIQGANRGVRIYEEDGNKLRLIEDFEETHRKEGGESWFGGWSGQGPMGGKVDGDPVRGVLYYREAEHSGSSSRLMFDLKTGAFLGEVQFHGAVDDIAFDKRGYLHAHFSPGFNVPGVGRFDPDQHATLFPGNRQERAGGREAVAQRVYKEVPYDYGVQCEPKGGLKFLNANWKRWFGSDGWLGLLPVRDQAGSCFFQDGLGVNMRGDIAENCNVSYVPKMGDENEGQRFEVGGGGKRDAYIALMKEMQEREKLGEMIYYLRRQPGVRATGATIWTFDCTGELRQETAVIAGRLINSVQMDEDGKLYFTADSTRLYDGKPFLAGRGGVIGGDKRETPFTGTFVKAGEKDVRFLTNKAPIPLGDDKPKRPPELAGPGTEEVRWAEGVEWLYAGSSPIVPGQCKCPTQRSHTDWYKRSYVPEMYRHSFGILDTNGNMIMHIGRYGNFDECPSLTGRLEDITKVAGRFIGGTDDYVAFSDRGERITVLKLKYHAEESVRITNR